MVRIPTPVIAGAIVAALASTTGYCVLQKGPSAPPPPPPAAAPPVRMLPEAVIPYPLEDES